MKYKRGLENRSSAPVFKRAEELLLCISPFLHITSVHLRIILVDIMREFLLFLGYTQLAPSFLVLTLSFDVGRQKKYPFNTNPDRTPSRSGGSVESEVFMELFAIYIILGGTLITAITERS